MLTRREKLLIRPWQLRRYNNHRKKVLAARAVIDFGPPAQRGHVTLKLKKLQTERERRTKIEEDNFRLLQRMGSIMKKNRLDNFWDTKPPTFLRRVGIYHRTRSPSPCEEESFVSLEPPSNARKSRCSACTPQSDKQKQVPDYRTSKETRGKSPSKKKSIPIKPTTPEADPQPKTGSSFAGSKTSRVKRNVNPFKPSDSLVSVEKAKSSILDTTEKKIILEQGSVQLEVNFPMHVDVKVKSAKGERFIQRGHCGCQVFKKTTHNSLKANLK